MKKLIAIFLFVWMGRIAQAHQPDLSTLIISENANGQYFLEITSSLTAFESEVDFKYGESSYKTPEEFKKLALKHFYESILISFNSPQKISFGNAKVILGHETKLIVEILKMPKVINSILIKNGFFQDIPQNQCITILFSKNLPKQQFILAKDNDHRIDLKLENGNWTSVDDGNNLSGFNIIIMPTVILIILLALIAFLKNSKTKVLNFSKI